MIHHPNIPLLLDERDTSLPCLLAGGRQGGLEFQSLVIGA
jgi:hypothetical protein